jgi:type I restriction enzyme S subunit
MKVVKLSEVCTFSRGLTYSKSDEVELSNNVVLRANNIDLESNSLALEDLRYISNSVKIKSEKIAKKNSIIICTASGSKAHVGKVALIDDDYGYAFGGFMGQLTPTDICHPKFLYYILTSGSFKDFLMSLNDGTNINNLKFSDIEGYEVILPSLERQLEIVKKLDYAFAEIDLLEKNLDQNSEFILEIEASLVANLWVKYANELTVKRLEDVADYKNGSAHEKIVDENGDFIIVNSKFISSNGLKFKRSSKQLTPLKIGDVTMVLSDVPNGKALAKCFLVDKDDTYTLNQRICKLTSEILLPEFLSLNMNRNPYLLSFNNGENQTNLRLNDVLKTPIYVANKATQKLITDEFLEAKRTILEYSKMNLRKAESLNLLKQSLLVSNFSDLERDVA